MIRVLDAMTPRQADIAYVLESVPGVEALYALGGRTAFAGNLRFAAKLEPGGRALAAAHFALLRAMTHAECSSVLLFDVELSPRVRADATPLVLSVVEREEAHQRVPVSSAALEQQEGPRSLPRYERSDFRWMIVDGDPALHAALEGAFGAASKPEIEPDLAAAFTAAQREPHHLILCDARLAFGSGGLLAQLYAADREAARRVILVAHEGERELLLTNLDELGVWNSFLCRPVDAATLRELLDTGSVVQQWARSALPEGTLPPRRVLVVDDDSTTAMLLAATGSELEATVTSDEWEALDHLADEGLDLVVCSLALRTRGDTPFYRLLWNARPDIKRRFVFIARADAAPVSTSAAMTVVERPLTREVVLKLVDRFPRAARALRDAT